MKLHSTANRKLKMENGKENGTVMFIKSVLCFLRFIVYTYSSPTYSRSHAETDKRQEPNEIGAESGAGWVGDLGEDVLKQQNGEVKDRK